MQEAYTILKDKYSAKAVMIHILAKICADQNLKEAAQINWAQVNGQTTTLFNEAKHRIKTCNGKLESDYDQFTKTFEFQNRVRNYIKTEQELIFDLDSKLQELNAA